MPRFTTLSTYSAVRECWNTSLAREMPGPRDPETRRLQSAISDLVRPASGGMLFEEASDTRSLGLHPAQLTDVKGNRPVLSATGASCDCKFRLLCPYLLLVPSHLRRVTSSNASFGIICQGGCTSIEDGGIVGVVEQCAKSLRVLDLHGLRKVTTASIICVLDR